MLMNHNLFSSLSDWGGGGDVPVVQPDRAGDLRRRRVRRAAPGGEEQGQEGVQGARKGIARLDRPLMIWTFGMGRAYNLTRYMLVYS